MSRPFPDVPLFRAFECLTFDSVAQEDLFPVPAHVHYFSEVILVRSGICRVVRGTRAVALQPGELIYISPLVSHSIDLIESTCDRVAWIEKGKLRMIGPTDEVCASYRNLGA